jgi:hypothetical protein
MGFSACRNIFAWAAADAPSLCSKVLLLAQNPRNDPMN